MDSNQWEVVTKSRKQKNMDRKVEAHLEKKRMAAVPIKLEEIFPSQQYRAIISGKDNKTPLKTQSTTKPSKSKSPPKKQAKPNVKAETDSSSRKSSQIKLPPKPKSPEEALRKITPDDFSAHLEQLKLTFPGSRLLWLKGVASYLNTNLPFGCDPTFSGKSVDYPCSLLTGEWKAVLSKFLADMGAVNLTYFHYTLLTTMAMELAKNLTVFGYKLLLQLMARTQPDIICSNLAKIALLRNSYQNRSHVCLSILWAVGQCGYEQLAEGTKVWQNIMLPNLEMKSYTRFVIEYLEKVLKYSQNQSLKCVFDEFYPLYTSLLWFYPNISKDNEKQLNDLAELLLRRFIASADKANLLTLFYTFLQSSRENNDIEIAACIKCLIRNEDIYSFYWKANFQALLGPSLLLISSIEEGCDEYAVEVRNSFAYKEFIRNLQIKKMAEYKDYNREKYINCKTLTNYKDYNRKKYIHWTIFSRLPKGAQQSKKNAACQKQSCRYWLLGSLFLAVAIGVTVFYDTEVNGHGVFGKSVCGTTLAKAGMLPYVEKAWYTTMSASARAYKWAEVNVPPYAKPGFMLCCDIYKLARNTVHSNVARLNEYITARIPAMAQMLESKLPGSTKKIEIVSKETQRLFSESIAKIVSFCNAQVFVGIFSYENMGKVYNASTDIAAEGYRLFQKKIDYYAKLK